MESTITSCRGSRWIRPGLMRFRASPRGGSRGSKGITAMLWGCRWRWCIGCCGSGEFSERHALSFYVLRGKLGLFFFLFFFLRLFPFFHRGLEVADAFADTFADSRELAGAEKQKRDGYH